MQMPCAMVEDHGHKKESNVICLRREEEVDADWRVNKAACILSRDLTPRIRRYNLSNEDIHVGMRFPSGIAAGPVPAEPTGRPAARRSFQQSCKSIQTYSKLFPDIYADTVTIL